MNVGERVVLITGAANGIGAALASTLADAGHFVAAVDYDSDKLRRFHERSASGDKIFPITADLVDDHACEDSVRQTLSCFDRIDAVINNVGIGVSSIRSDAERNHPTIEEMSPALWDRFFAINVRAAMLVTRAAIPHMKAQHWGRIINNTTSYRTMLRVLPYGATKAALESMSAVWAAELAGS
jgi:NAD(P)-dependent dehydrogenase (short-subunit alcohol dehydrogenase family)